MVLVKDNWQDYEVLKGLAGERDVAVLDATIVGSIRPIKEKDRRRESLAKFLTENSAPSYVFVIPDFIDTQLTDIFAGNYVDEMHVLDRWYKKIDENKEVYVCKLFTAIGYYHKNSSEFDKFEQTLPGKWRNATTAVLPKSKGTIGSMVADKGIIYTALKTAEQMPNNSHYLVSNDRRDVFTAHVSTHLDKAGIKLLKEANLLSRIRKK